MSRPYFDLVATGKRMRDIRKSRKFTVEQVRDYMEFESVQSIYKWERGECLPQADTLIALSILYKVNPIEFFQEDAEASSYVFKSMLYCIFFDMRRKHLNVCGC
ncbi:MAG: helix-turn-helix domain-containing protein [Lachnospiraceae bacterium]|nr:helix-turn-helix domain-containing protein [Lachnospiraceae bacterium]